MRYTEGSVDVRADVEYEAGDRLTLRETDTEANLYVSRPDRTPLRVESTHATLRLSTDNGEVTATLNGETLDALLDSLYNVQRFHEGDDA